MSLHVLDVVQPWCQWIIDVNDNNLPISLLLVEQSHDAKDFDLLDLARGSDEFADFADIQRIIIAFGLGLRVNNIRIFPRLQRAQQGLWRNAWKGCKPEGKHHNSKDIHDGGSNCERIGACPS